MKLAIGCDEAAWELKELFKAHLAEKGCEVIDCGTYDKAPVLYPDIAVKVCREILEGECQRGILLCGTGIGMAMSANKVPGIRAAVCHDVFSTRRSILSNNAQVFCLGARVVAPQLALSLLDEWLPLVFRGGASQEKIDRMMHYQEEFCAAGRG